jgi:hypothetical protein
MAKEKTSTLTKEGGKKVKKTHQREESTAPNDEHQSGLAVLATARTEERQGGGH